MIIFKGNTLIDKNFNPVLITKIDLKTKRVYGVFFDDKNKNKDKHQFNKDNANLIAENDNNGFLVGNNTAKNFHLIDEKKAINVDEEKDYWKYYFIYSVKFWVLKILNKIDYKEKYLHGQPLPHRQRYIIEQYADYIKHQHFTRVRAEYLKDKYNLISYLKSSKITNIKSVDLIEVQQIFGNEYNTAQITETIKHLNYKRK